MGHDKQRKRLLLWCTSKKQKSEKCQVRCEEISLINPTLSAAAPSQNSHKHSLTTQSQTQRGHEHEYVCKSKLITKKKKDEKRKINIAS